MVINHRDQSDVREAGRTILSSMNAEELTQAIAAEDIASLKRVKGIGAKTAGRIILELKDKLGSGLSDQIIAGQSKKGQLGDNNSI